MLIYRPSATRS